MLKYALFPSSLVRQGTVRNLSTAHGKDVRPGVSARVRFRHVVLSAAAIMAVSTSLNVAKAQTPARSEVAAPNAVAQPVEALYAGLRKLEANTDLSAAQRVKIMTPVIDAAFDLPTILRNSVGMRFANLSAQDQQSLLDSFRRFTVARYVSSFGKGEKTNFSIKPQSAATSYGDGKIIRSTIAGPDNRTEIDYVVQNLPHGYRITDVLLNGHISQVAAQRADFSAGLASGGAEGLKTLLDRKTKTFLGN
ncbi:ABC transporter substrate-binding protein [Candidatus Kirkpatrickella diaphorinae]|uniref:ABC transporter substrate-binding protein n=1 Tax=Candidatus Kirkpatrickella diaphorinae TaxID=2984322 RepID=A0ABY6GGY0_9PROT|nr:ABC transporter substrate-binding protein [Candidatus Kirkpatrickella diaphorinae]UYH50762.1 ABC transporter substrate-binding protein [Candidatus Kirkpatrickella diaphorinae]